MTSEPHAFFPPVHSSTLRACKTCRMIRPIDIWRQQSCPNCDSSSTNGYRGIELQRHVTSQFDGCVNILSSESSWVCRSLRLTGKLVPGKYAMRLINLEKNQDGEFE